MNPFFKKLEKTEGQALAEMVISIPILFLFAAGIIQFSIFFLAYVNFEHACGEAARQYAAGFIDEDSLKVSIFENVGYFDRFLDQNSLSISVAAPRSIAGSTFGAVSNLISSLNTVAHSLPLPKKVDFSEKYEGCLWNISVRCHPPAFFGLLFPNGIELKTTMQVYRYSG